MSDDSGTKFARGNYGKHRRQEIDSVQRIRNNRLRCEERKTPQPETLADSDTSDHRWRSGSVQTTTNGRLWQCGFRIVCILIEQRAFRENAYLEWMDVSVMRSPLESKDRPERHSGEDGADNRSTSN